MPDSEKHTAAREIAQALPVLQKLSFAGDEQVQLVNQMIVEEVLQDLGILDFGKGITAKANASLWRSRGEHRSLVGEFSFQASFAAGMSCTKRRCTGCQKFFVDAAGSAGRLGFPVDHQDGDRLPAARQPAHRA